MTFSEYLSAWASQYEDDFFGTTIDDALYLSSDYSDMDARVGRMFRFHMGFE